MRVCLTVLFFIFGFYACAEEELPQGIYFYGDQRTVGMRYQAGVKLVGADLGEVVSSDGSAAQMLNLSLEEVLEFLQIEMGGGSHMVDPYGGAFLDFHFGDAGRFAYIGLSFGFINLGMDYGIRSGFGPVEISVESSDWIRVFQHEVGLGFQMTDRRALNFGYEFSKFG